MLGVQSVCLKASIRDSCNARLHFGSLSSKAGRHGSDNSRDEWKQNALKALIAAEYSDVKVELAKDFQMGVTNKTPEFLKMNPLGKIPILKTPEGPVFKSIAIACYVKKLKANNPLFGSTLIEHGKIEQWIYFATTEIDANTGQWLYPRLGYQVYLPPAEEAAITALKRAPGALNTHLASRTFLVGDTVALSDDIITCKYAFGKMLVIGIPKFVLDECYNMELYEWKEVDINDEAQKVRVNQMIEDAEPFEGEALLLDAKCFK
ncbi:OLC1v1025368C1 [Oldenlandia corymbosa var. corymbosa]|uniref:OLC1v1025368C1 n=1 Tax=Oldenlandia corymbosa var. corymbosa TaxID=529605 RepID=A0AAV1C4K6_OLDCO|nr:OLC1v1025368C1 [Oldenlandia corymbosa var. corymbosa]